MMEANWRKAFGDDALREADQIQGVSWILIRYSADSDNLVLAANEPHREGVAYLIFKSPRYIRMRGYGQANARFECGDAATVSLDPPLPAWVRSGATRIIVVSARDAVSCVACDEVELYRNEQHQEGKAS